MKKSFLCISLLSLCLLSGCKQWFDAQPDPDESKIAAAVATQEAEIETAINEKLKDSGSTVWSVHISDSDISISFKYGTGNNFANECTAAVSVLESLPEFEDIKYKIYKYSSSYDILYSWDNTECFHDYRNEEVHIIENISLDQLANLEFNSNSSSLAETTRYTVLTDEDYIQANLRSYISDYDYTTVDSITINDDAGTDTPDDYIALVNLTWSQKNSQETTKKMLDMYSQDMAARIYKDSSSVQEICIFWTIPYLNASANGVLNADLMACMQPIKYFLTKLTMSLCYIYIGDSSF